LARLGKPLDRPAGEEGSEFGISSHPTSIEPVFPRHAAAFFYASACCLRQPDALQAGGSDDAIQPASSAPALRHHMRFAATAR